MEKITQQNRKLIDSIFAKAKMLLNFNKTCLSLIILLAIVGQSYAQVTLGTSPYSENFSTIPTALPTGWTVRTAATATALGTAASFITTQTAWSSSTGQFANCASANGLTSAASAATQNASTDRAPSIRQTGAVGDPGAAFVLQIANTTSKTAFNLSLKLILVLNGSLLL